MGSEFPGGGQYKSITQTGDTSLWPDGPSFSMTLIILL